MGAFELPGGGFCERVSNAAVRALLYELMTTPKPGLVDRRNNGAHADMDFALFIDSAMALAPYFKDVCALGTELGRDALWKRARVRGIEAEREMLDATRGVNTHKGAIFSLGLLCMAAGVLKAQGRALDRDALLEACAAQAGRALEDFRVQKEGGQETHGERQYALNGARGARGEAAGGFKSVRELAYPTLLSLLNQGASVNDAGAITLLHLISHVDDTNMLHRGGPQAHKEIKAGLSAFLEGRPSIEAALDKARELDKSFIERNISPGGCADLLAFTWLLHFLTTELFF